MKVYKFTAKAIVAAPDELNNEDLVSVTRCIKEAYEYQFMRGVLMSNVVVQVEQTDEITTS